MAALSFATSAGEALILGLTTGPVCLASCGPVVLPWMLVQPRGVRGHSQQLSLFLIARLAGYLLFATAVWYAGSAIPRSWVGRSWLFGGLQLLLAVALVVYAAGWPVAPCTAAQPKQRLVQIETGSPPRTRPQFTGALALGFLTGVNLCPPFLMAGARAAQLPQLSGALLFFACFFVGTALWFAPFVSLGILRRTPSLVTVARMVALLLACWYGFSGASVLIERVVYG